MAKTDEIIQALLTADEPDYERARTLGPEAIPVLLSLARGAPAEAARAVWIASFVPDPAAADVIAAGADHRDPMVRAAAGAAARDVAGAAARVVPTLLRDRDAGVRKQALRAGAAADTPALATLIGRIARNDPEPFLRKAAADALKKPVKR